MDLSKSFACQACGATCEQHADACPSCGDRFFWLVVVAEVPSPTQVQEFIDALSPLVAHSDPRKFLTHGGHLWLPPGFWTQNSWTPFSASFPWVKSFRLVQHGAASRKPLPKTKASSGQASSSISTDPSPSKMEQSFAAVEVGTTGASSPGSGESAVRAKARPQSLRVSAATITKKPSKSHWRAPLAVFTCSLFLAAAYMVLLYHRYHS